MKNKPKQMLFVVRQYIMANNAQHAIKIAKKSKVHEVWVDEDFRKNMANSFTPPVGYSVVKS